MSDEVQAQPNVAEVERCVLGACLIHPEGTAQVAGLLTPECFYVDAHSEIYRALLAMFDRGDPIDLITVRVELKKRGTLDQVGGIYYVVELANGMASNAHIEFHARLIVESFIARESIRVQTESANRGFDASADAFDLIDNSIEKLQATVDKYARLGSDTFARHEVEEIEALDNPKAGSQPTGFAELSNKIGGWSAGDLVVIAARPGMGKTGTMISLSNEAASNGFPTLLIQMELVKKANQARIVACRSGIPLEDMVHDRMSAAQIAMRHQCLSDAEKLPMLVRYDTGLTLSEIRAEIMRAKRTHGITTVFIDQLNWIQGPKAVNREQQVSVITRTLKQMAIKLDVCIIMAHQLNRQAETRGGSKVPQLSDLRESGSVEQDVQIAILLYRPEYYGITDIDGVDTTGYIQLIVAKNSNGSTGPIGMRFNASTASISSFQTTFRDPAPQYEQEPF